MASLFNLTADWQRVYDMLNDPDIPEEAVFDTIELIEMDMDDKADAYAAIITAMSGDVDVISAEEKRLNDRKRAIENRISSMKQNLYTMMQITGRTKFKTALHSFAIQKNGGAAPIVWSEKPVPAEWLKPGEPNVIAIRKALEAGEELDFAALGERGESLRIR